jgi:hypothetical protein
MEQFQKQREGIISDDYGENSPASSSKIHEGVEISFSSPTRGTTRNGLHDLGPYLNDLGTPKTPQERDVLELDPVTKKYVFNDASDDWPDGGVDSGTEDDESNEEGNEEDFEEDRREREWGLRCS